MTVSRRSPRRGRRPTYDAVFVPTAAIAVKPRLLSTAVLLAASLSAQAALPDLSGTYDCKGLDSKEGAYTATVTMTRNPSESVERYGSYGYAMQVPGYGTYLGEAVATADHIAIRFALVDPTTRDFGTGLARITRRGPKTTFEKFYYEPEFKGGNHGTERCTRR